MKDLKWLLMIIIYLLMFIMIDTCKMAKDTARIKELMHLNNSILNDIYIKKNKWGD